MRRMTGLDGLGVAATLTMAMALFASPAIGGSHQWRFSEFYSSPDRSIQFIEMMEIAGSEAEGGIGNRWFETNSFNADHSQTLGSNLPQGTAFKKFLVGSQSYAALPGVPTPDYIVPDGILEPDGDTIMWWFYQTIVIAPGVMPSDGVMSITVVDPVVPSFSVGVNSPTNFAGETGTVVLPTALPVSSTVGAITIVLTSALLGFWVLRRRVA